MGVAALEGIEGPRHLVHAHGEGTLALGVLELRAQVEMAVGIEHGEHVGVDGGLPMLAPEESEGESDHLLFPRFVFCEGAEEDVAGCLQRDRHGHGERVFVGHSPDFFLDSLQLIELVDGAEIADGDLWGGSSHWGPVYRSG